MGFHLAQIHAFLVVVFFVLFQVVSPAAGVAVTKEQRYYSNDSAKAFVYSEIKDLGWLVRFKIGNRSIPIKRTDSNFLDHVEVPKLSPNIFSEEQIKRTKEQTQAVVEFSGKYKQARPILASYVEARTDIVQRLEDGDRRVNGEWLTAQEFAARGEKLAAADESKGVQIKMIEGDSFPLRRVIKKSVSGIRIVADGSIKSIPWTQINEPSKVLLGYKDIVEAEARKQEQMADFRKMLAAGNSLGMKFVPAGTPGVFFSVWEARVADFRKFVTETDYDAIESSTNGFRSFTWEGEEGWELAGGSWQNPRFPASAKQNDEHPVVCVSYLDAEAFCAWLTKKERAAGRIPANASYRLPTDGEWSRACGLGKYPWGNTFPPKRNEGNYCGKETGSIQGNEFSRADGAGRTSAVGMYGANRYGLHDMGGNVFEWCGTWYRDSLNEADVLEKHPFLKDQKRGGGWDKRGENRVLRGGSWINFTEVALRSSSRTYYTPYARMDGAGFRCVLSVG